MNETLEKPQKKLTRKVSGPAISRVLRKAGFGIVVDHRREGIRVRGGNCHSLGVRVSAQFDGTLYAEKVASGVEAALKERGYTVTRNGAWITVFK